MEIKTEEKDKTKVDVDPKDAEITRLTRERDEAIAREKTAKEQADKVWAKINTNKKQKIEDDEQPLSSFEWKLP